MHEHAHAAGLDHEHDHDAEIHGRHHRPEVPRLQHVVLDIGDGIGALIVRTGPELLGSEVEISPAADDGRRSHKEVLERTSVAGESEHVLVFDDLPEGRYTLWFDGRPRSRGVEVRGGEVARLDWRAAEAAVAG